MRLVMRSKETYLLATLVGGRVEMHYSVGTDGSYALLGLSDIAHSTIRKLIMGGELAEQSGENIKEWTGERYNISEEVVGKGKAIDHYLDMIRKLEKRIEKISGASEQATYQIDTSLLETI